jgi:hypothetical protein
MIEILRLTKRGADGKRYVDLEFGKREMEGRLTAQRAFFGFTDSQGDWRWLDCRTLKIDH